MKKNKFYICICLLLIGSFANTYAQDVLGNLTDEGTLKIEIFNNTRMQVWRYTNSQWVPQWYDANTAYNFSNPSFEPDRGYKLYIDGTHYTDPNGYVNSGTAYTSVVDNKIDNNNHEQLATVSGMFTLKQIIYYPANSSTIEYSWEITNISGGDLNNLRFLTGGDSFLAGVDSGQGFWDAADDVIGVTKTTGTGLFVELYLESISES